MPRLTCRRRKGQCMRPYPRTSLKESCSRPNQRGQQIQLRLQILPVPAKRIADNLFVRQVLQDSIAAFGYRTETRPVSRQPPRARHGEGQRCMWNQVRRIMRGSDHLCLALAYASFQCELDSRYDVVPFATARLAE